VRQTLQEIVASAPQLFAGAVREEGALLRRVEADLAITFPEDVHWFLTSCGSGRSNAAPSIEDAANDTLRFRSAVDLPRQYIVLDDRGDAGVVILDTSSSAGPVFWVGMHLIENFPASLSEQADYDAFESFAAWVEFCIADTESW
jgi:hypothetical protein